LAQLLLQVFSWLIVLGFCVVIVLHNANRLLAHRFSYTNKNIGFAFAE
jgi:hypothetical protein